MVRIVGDEVDIGEDEHNAHHQRDRQKKWILKSVVRPHICHANLLIIKIQIIFQIIQLCCHYVSDLSKVRLQRATCIAILLAIFQVAFRPLLRLN